MDPTGPAGLFLHQGPFGLDQDLCRTKVIREGKRLPFRLFDGGEDDSSRVNGHVSVLFTALLNGVRRRSSENLAHLTGPATTSCHSSGVNRSWTVMTDSCSECRPSSLRNGSSPAHRPGRREGTGGEGGGTAGSRPHVSLAYRPAIVSKT